MSAAHRLHELHGSIARGLSRARGLLGLVLAGCAAPPALGIPSYIAPGPELDALVEGAGARPGSTLIINPNSGPTPEGVLAYRATLAAARARGVRVLGYVSTEWGKRSPDAVDADVSLYLGSYGTDGIFFDQVPGEAGCAAAVPWYEARAAAARAARPGGRITVVLNPGGHSCEGYLRYADAIVIIESTGAEVLAWRPQAWVSSYPASRFWLLAHTTPASELRALLAHARRSNAGQVYVTDGAMPNPWGALPSYWSAEVSAVR